MPLVVQMMMYCWKKVEVQTVAIVMTVLLVKMILWDFATCRYLILHYCFLELNICNFGFQV